jgi:hypothetical protein
MEINTTVRELLSITPNMGIYDIADAWESASVIAKQIIMEKYPEIQIALDTYATLVKTYKQLQEVYAKAKQAKTLAMETAAMIMYPGGFPAPEPAQLSAFIALKAAEAGLSSLPDQIKNAVIKLGLDTPIKVNLNV